MIRDNKYNFKKETVKECKKMSKKSDHKHEYELKEIAENEWFTHELICKICGHVGNRLAIYK